MHSDRAIHYKKHIQIIKEKFQDPKDGPLPNRIGNILDSDSKVRLEPLTNLVIKRYRGYISSIFTLRYQHQRNRRLALG